MAKWTSLWLYAIAITILIISKQSVCQNDKVNRKADMVLDLGSIISGQVYHNETKGNNQLGLTETQIEVQITSSFTKEKSYIKQTRYEHLQLCDTLNLVFSKHLDMMDCKPWKSHLLYPELPEVSADVYGSGDYIRLSKLRTKWKTRGGSGKRDILLYPLKQEVVLQSIQEILMDNELDGPPDSSRADIGFYFEGASANAKSDNPIVCAGRLFISLNGTDNKFKFDQVDTVNFFLERRDGFIINIQDMNCHKPSSSLFKFSIDLDFTIIKRPQFPYLIVKASTSTRPIKQVLQFESKLSQKQDSDSTNPQKYNTTISIHASSFFLPGFNFDLDQIWVNEDAKTGWEKMIFEHPSFPIAVEAVWNATNFLKTGKFFSLDPKESYVDFEKSMNDIKEAVKVHYNDEKAKDYVTLSFDVRRDLLGVTEFLSDSLYKFVGVETEPNDDGSTTTSSSRDEL